MKTILFLVISFSLFFAPEVFSQKANEIEHFESFLVKFKTDSTFQKSRLISPVIIIYSTGDLVETSDGLYEFALDTIQVKAEDWKFETLSFQAKVSEQVINRIDGLIDYEIAGLNNGILVIYTFVTKDRKWYLKSYNNQST